PLVPVEYRESLSGRMLSSPTTSERHSKSGRAAPSVGAGRSCTPLRTSKDPMADSPRCEAPPRFRATPRTAHLHAATRQAAPPSRTDQSERYGRAPAPMAGVELWLRTAVVDMDVQHFRSLPSLPSHARTRPFTAFANAS